MVETRNWLEMPNEIMGGMILQRILDAVEILMSVQKVCTTWRRICKDPAMWKVIDMNHRFDGLSAYDVEKLSKEAVNRSCGELIDITLKPFCSNNLLDHISCCSSKLKRISIRGGFGITGCGISNALKKLPHLETLELSYTSICAKDIEVIGRNCPHLKSFTMRTQFPRRDDDFVIAIANSMPALLHLKLVGTSGDEGGIQAILNGCPHLESLHLLDCFYYHLEKNLEKLCRERIKDFKFNWDNILEADEDSDMRFGVYDMNGYYDDDDALGDYGVSGGSGDDYDFDTN